MAAYRAAFGHIGDHLPGAHFASRKEAKDAGLTKEAEAGISWGRDVQGEVAADAIVLNHGYEDDVDWWSDIIYTGHGGQDRSTKRQVRDQNWTDRGNAALRRSGEREYPVRVLRGASGEELYSPVTGYRYDGLYQVVEWRQSEGQAGFQMCRFRLRRLTDDQQELTPIEQQIADLLAGVPPRRTSTIDRIVRDTAVSRRVKSWYRHRCQICQLALTVGADGASYAEGAHIQSLGNSDPGPDVDGNVLCLCPNCHIRFDRGALYLTDDLRVVDRFAAEAPRVRLTTDERHRIQKRFVRAHRRRWRIVEQEV
ncbi:YDG/SRA domain-containing protein [Streptomyces sp. NBC_01304]|uniref:YDG/SRA domain-containing protein n=1 Tax=Streptomyces sp. NBC_01304 TaxID=2903818 RepID=UPI002E109114|nr:HNH endonuclease [Streptomyces sp. NBC_01304]